MTSTTSPAASKPWHVTPADIARLAGVQRSVVSMWRVRPVPGTSFPAPTGRRGGQELFDATQVVDYLRSTGRGLNPEVAEDVAAHVALAGVSSLPESTAVAGLSALLCLLVSTGAPLGELTVDDVLDLATEDDPDDVMLPRELHDLGSELPGLAAHAEALADAAYAAPSAFELLLHRHRGTCLPGHAATARRDVLDRLVGRLSSALLAHVAGRRGAGAGTPALVDDGDGDGGLLLAAREAWGEGDLDLLCSTDSSEVARWTRRRLAVHGHSPAPVRAPGPVVHLRQLPDAGRPDREDVALVEDVLDLTSRLGSAEVAVVVGPAPALVDPDCPAALSRARDAVLRSGALRASVRLPSGLLVRSPRRALALWVLTRPSYQDQQDRWLAVGELVREDLDDAGVDDLISDVLAVVDASNLPFRELVRRQGTDAAQVPLRRLRHLRRTRVVDALMSSAGLRVLVAPPPTTTTAGEVTAHLASCGTLRAGGVGVQGVAVTGGLRTAPVGRLVRDRHLRVVKGMRLDGVPVHLGVTTGVAVLGLAEVLGESPLGSRRVDLLALTARSPGVRLTRPGDVVFVVSPRPAALLDAEGGAVLQAPARVLRPTPEGAATLLPHLMVDAVTGAARTGGAGRQDYRRWLVPLVPAVQRELLHQALTSLDADRQELRERLALLDAAASALMAGVAGGSVVVTPDGAPP